MHEARASADRLRLQQAQLVEPLRYDNTDDVFPDLSWSTLTRQPRGGLGGQPAGRYETDMWSV